MYVGQLMYRDEALGARTIAVVVEVAGEGCYVRWYHDDVITGIKIHHVNAGPSFMHNNDWHGFRAAVVK